MILLAASLLILLSLPAAADISEVETERCLAAFDAGVFAASSGATERPADPAKNGELQEQGKHCRLQGGISVLVTTGLREHLQATASQSEPSLDVIRRALQPLAEEDWQELESFGLCAPPNCPEHSYVALGWHFLLHHAFGLPAKYAKGTVPINARASVIKDDLQDNDLAEAPSSLLTQPIGESASLKESDNPEAADLEDVNAMCTPHDPGGECRLLSTDPEGVSHHCRRHLFERELSCCKNDSVSQAAGLVPWPGAQAVLPDFDCTSNPIFENIWADIRSFLDTLGLFAETGSARASGFVDEASELEIWANYVELFFEHRGFGAVSSDQALDAECPFGYLALQMVRWAACLLAGGVPGRCSRLRVHVGHAIVDAPYGLCDMHLALPVLLNSRWMRPICELTSGFKHHAKARSDVLDPDGAVEEAFGCRAVEGQILDWKDYRRLLRQGKTQFTEDSTIKYTFSQGWDEKVTVLSEQCPVGVLMMFLEKLRIAQKMKTEEYAAFAHGIGSILLTLERHTDWEAPPSDSFSLFMLSDWPFFNLLCSTSFQAQDVRPDQVSHGYQHKPFLLDFLPEEILKSPSERKDIARLRALSRPRHLEYLRSLRRGRASATFRALLAALETALGVGSSPDAPLKLVITTLIWGARLSVYLRAALQRAHAFGLARHSVVFCLDEDSCNTCRKEHYFVANCVRGSLKTIFNKYTIASAALHLGFDVLYLDFDTLLMKNPLPPILKEAENAEILVSRDFGSVCLNTGVIYFKAHEDTADFVSTLLVWMWHHPYEFSQKAFSAFLLVENVTRAPFDLPMAKVPRWKHLDPINAFVTNTVYNQEVEGWTGNLDDIVVFHFLDGTGGVDPEKAVRGEYANLYDLFYANNNLNLSDASVPLWKQDKHVENVILFSRKPAVPQSLYSCTLA